MTDAVVVKPTTTTEYCGILNIVVTPQSDFPVLIFTDVSGHC